jgi:hypothetical protein
MIFGAFLGRPDRRAAPSRHILFDGVGVISDVEACLSADSRCSMLFPIVLDAEGMGSVEIRSAGLGTPEDRVRGGIYRARC